jgi:heptosyltransferase-2
MSPERILIRAPNWIGDVVLSLPAVRDLRRSFPGARIEVLARPSVSELYHAVAEIDEVRVAQGVLADRDRLRDAFDTVVLLPNSFGSALPPWLARIPERWGYGTDCRGVLLTRRVRVPTSVRGTSEVYYYRAMLAGLGLDVSSPPDATLQCPEPWREDAAQLLRESGVWIGVNPGAAFGSAKRWLPMRYAAAAERLARHTGGRVAILGGGSERELGEAIAAQISAPVRNLCGETNLGELTGVLAQLAFLVTNDSGPMHVASALGTPSLAIFGPTDWRETAPVGSGARIVREPVSCAPCKLRDCPIDHRCMRGVSVERVVEGASELLGLETSA